MLSGLRMSVHQIKATLAEKQGAAAGWRALETRRTKRIFFRFLYTSRVVALDSSIDHVAQRLVQANSEIVGLAHEQVDAVRPIATALQCMNLDTRH